jgi:hypothetical protein
MSQITLLRYNFRVMMLNNRWLVAFPLVVSQLTVFWFLLTRQYSPDLPAQSVEVVTPLLAAFLGAHLLSAEYRSRIGALLASRPVNISRIVVLRLFVMLALVWGLALLSLVAYTYGKQPFDVKRPILACIPSTLFLTMLALTFATLFRHSLAGFAVAALYWAIDLTPGAPLQPYMSLRALTSYYAVYMLPARQTFLPEWWISKVFLLVGALLLYLYHSRIVFTLGSAQTLRLRRGAIIGASVLLVFYLVSGAVLKVAYGYTHRGKLPGNDLAWFRYQFAPYGPIPVAALFGPAFTRYVGEIANPWRASEGEDADVMGDTVKHNLDLKYVLEKMPNSMWAPGAADALARLQGRRQSKIEDAIALNQIIVDRYPHSPYVDYALRRSAKTLLDAGRAAEARGYYMELLKRAPDSIYRSEALKFMVESDSQANHMVDAARWAGQWTAAAPVEDKFEAWIDLAKIRKAQGDAAGAKQAAQTALTAVAEFRRAMAADTLSLLPFQKVVRERTANTTEQLAHTFL